MNLNNYSLMRRKKLANCPFNAVFKWIYFALLLPFSINLYKKFLNKLLLLNLLELEAVQAHFSKISSWHLSRTLIK